MQKNQSLKTVYLSFSFDAEKISEIIIRGHIRTLFIYLNLLINCVPNFANDIVRLGLLADHKVMPGNHISESLPNEIFKRHKWSKNL